VNAKAVAKSFGEDIHHVWETHRVPVIIIGVILLAVIIMLLLWGSGVLWSGTTSSTSTPGAAHAQLGNTDGIKKLNGILNDHADRLNKLSDDDGAIKKDLQSLKSDVSALKGGQQQLQKDKLDFNDLNRQINEELKVTPLKPLSQLNSGEFPSQRGNFLPRPA
jgi:hypothetical protein